MQQYGVPGLSSHQAEQLKAFWASQTVEVSEVPADPAVFKNHQLPLARIKKIMKSDEDVRMISAEAPVLFAKACEMFILELTLRSWMHAEENKRRTLQRNDVAAAITKTDIFDFLVDIVPREDLNPADGQAAGGAPAPTSSGQPAAAPPAAAAPGSAAPGAGPGGAAGPRPPAPGVPPGGLPPPGPNMFFPYPMPNLDPAAAAAAAAAMSAMRPPLPMAGVDPALVSMYQQQILAGQGWPAMPGLPPPPGGAAPAPSGAQASTGAPQPSGQDGGDEAAQS